MRKLLILALVGLGAQLIDGALGMGYGVSSTSLLLVAGLSPAMASASVHLAEMGTNIASGISHHRLRNVDWHLVLKLGVPGALGAFVGATVLSNISTVLAQPIMSGILALLGVYILTRYFFRPPSVSTQTRSSHRNRFLVPLGLVGGFVDATGGGGWGPVSTTSLLSAGKTAPRTVIGSVDTSEFLVSVAASVGFVVSLGAAGINLWIVFALLAGGVIAAPVAAWLVSRLPARILGVAVGGFIVLVNLRALFAAGGIEPRLQLIGYVGSFLAWAVLVGLTVYRHHAAPSPDRPPTSDKPQNSDTPPIPDKVVS